MLLFKTKRLLFLIGGWIAFILGVIGAILPVMPTTPFIIIAGYCFSQGSKKWHHWLRKNKWFGKLIIDWEEHHSIATKTKVIASSLMLTVFSMTILLIKVALWIKGCLILVGLLVLAILWTRPDTNKSLITEKSELGKKL